MDVTRLSEMLGFPVLERQVEGVLDTLTSREREVIKLRYGINEEGFTYSLAETGQIFKVTRERIRQVEAKAIRKLKHPVRVGRLIDPSHNMPWMYATAMFPNGESE